MKEERAVMDAQQAQYANKLACEIDSWDLSVALAAGDGVVVVDARSPEAFARDHIPGAGNSTRPTRRKLDPDLENNVSKICLRLRSLNM